MKMPTFLQKTPWSWMWRLALVVLGGALMAGALYQKWDYSDLLRAGNQAVDWRRFDSLAYEKAARFPLANRGLVDYDLGVRAYQARNYKQAAEYFRRVATSAASPALKERSFYNLGNLLSLMGEAREAVGMYEEALRIDPGDWDAKHNLERLFVFNASDLNEKSKTVPLKQVPGNPNAADQGGGQGSGSGSSGPGI